MTDRSRIGRRNRQKGQEFEREIVHLSNDAGFACMRIKGSGAQATDHDDLTLATPLGELTIECKRKHDFKTIYGWLDSADIAVIRADRKEPIAVIPYRKLLELMK